MSSDNGHRDGDKEKNVYSIQTVDSVSEVASYEDAAVTQGAPTEKISPLGYHVDWLSVIFLVSLRYFAVFLHAYVDDSSSECQQNDRNWCFYNSYVKS